MTPEEQIEFQEQVTKSRYQLIAKCDEKLHTLLDAIVFDGRLIEWQVEALNKLAGIRIHFFRELLEMAALTRLRVEPGFANDYQNWVDLVNKGSTDEQKEEKE